MEIDLNLFGYILTSLSSTYLIYNTYKLISEPYGVILLMIYLSYCTTLGNRKEDIVNRFEQPKNSFSTQPS